MKERKYSVAEIDALRSVCRSRCLFGTSYTGPGDACTSWSYDARELAARVEESVRTHMMAGHTAEDIYEEDEARAENWKDMA